jgi:hypothetical protein
MNNISPPNIWRNIAAIPAALAVWWIGMKLVDTWLMSFLQGDDPDSTTFMFFIPIEPVSIWLIPFFQFLLVPGFSVYAASLVADSKKKYFAVAVTTIIILTSVLGVLFFTFGLRLEVSGMVIFRLWLWNIIGVASAAFGLFTVFEEHKA